MVIKNSSMKKVAPWPDGLNNILPETDIPRSSLRKALNIDLTTNGKPFRRVGRNTIYAASNVRSLYTSGALTVFAESNLLRRLFEDDTVTTLYTGLDANNLISYAEVNNIIYFTDGDNNRQATLGGIVSPLGLPIPDVLPELSATSTGGLDAGIYQVAVTEETSSGEESGAALGRTVTLTAGQGISLSGLPNNSDASGVNIYVTKADGDVFYQYASGVTGSTYSIVKGSVGKVLETQFMDRLPAGQIMFYYKGRLWVCQDTVLWYSEPLRFGLCRISMNFIQFPERITIGQPVLDGIYIVADRTYFLPGEDPKQMQQLVVSSDKAVEGTGTVLKPDIFNLDGVLEDAAYWFGSRGGTIGLPGGQVRAIMEDRVAVPDYVTGATMFREERGIQQVITSTTNPGEMPVLRFGDTASATVIRNGITLP